MQNNSLISVVIPCRNEEKYIGDCLHSLLNCASDHIQLEIFVCDGMSDDSTRDIVETFSRQHANIYLMDNPEQVTPVALNLGIKQARGSLIAILGAHATVSQPYFINALASFERNPEADCIGGLIENEFEDSRSEAVGMAMSSPFGVGDAHFRTGMRDGFVDTVAFGIYKREVFEKIGYFNESLARNQDDEFNFRMLKNNLKIFLDLSIRSKYYVRSSWKKLFQQYYQYGFWKVFVNKKHNTITTLRQLIPFLFVSGILCSLTLSLYHWIFFALFFAGLILWFVFALVFALKQTSRFIYLLQILLSFLILHISYGSGYLLGIWYFLILRKNPSVKHTKLTR